MNRRQFCIASSASLLTLAHHVEAQSAGSAATVPAQEFLWKTSQLILPFTIERDRIRQSALLPSTFGGSHAAAAGVIAALQLTGDNAVDSGTKQAEGNPGRTLLFLDKKDEPTATGRRLTLRQRDAERSLAVETIFESFADVPVLRCRTRITNHGPAPVGIEFLSSAMLHGLGNGQRFDDQLRVHFATNSWMSEAQWQSVRPSRLGFVENDRTCWNEAEATSIGSWSTEKYLPMALVEDAAAGLTWFWQIEHNGSWHWQVSNAGGRGQRATDVYAYLGGPDSLHHQAWKKLEPGATYETVPVAIGCVSGSFEQAVAAVTRYRRAHCMMPRNAKVKLPIIFNDYMNCLSGDPTEAKELPLIDAAADLGCEYFCIDAGWYAELNEDWSSTVGSWQPSTTRWPHGLKFTLDYIRSKGMIPGLWLEPEVAGRNSLLAAKPNDWFMIRHGERLIHNSRLLLDFRNPQVRDYLTQVIDRCVNEYGAGYFKFDYNTTSLEGTEFHADSLGQGLLEHNRAYLAWVERILARYPDLVLENCGSGGGRMDYAQLSRFQIQSVTDQEEYPRMPAIATGASAAVLPEQAAIWTYPLEDATADAASFNMVNALLGRIHQSGHLARLTPPAKAQVRTALALYRQKIRPMLLTACPFYPLGLPRISDHQSPVSLGMHTEQGSLISVWRLEGEATVTLSGIAGTPTILYPTDLGIRVERAGPDIRINFPRPKMGALLQLM